MTPFDYEYTYLEHFKSKKPVFQIHNYTDLGFWPTPDGFRAQHNSHLMDIFWNPGGPFGYADETGAVGLFPRDGN